MLDDFGGKFSGGVGGAAVAPGTGLGHIHRAFQEHERAVAQVEPQQVGERFDPGGQRLVALAGLDQTCSAVPVEGHGEELLDLLLGAHPPAGLVGVFGAEPGDQSRRSVNPLGFEVREGDLGLFAGFASQSEHDMFSGDGVVVEEAFIYVADLFDVDVSV